MPPHLAPPVPVRRQRVIAVTYTTAYQPTSPLMHHLAPPVLVRGHERVIAVTIYTTRHPLIPSHLAPPVPMCRSQRVVRVHLVHHRQQPAVAEGRGAVVAAQEEEGAVAEGGLGGGERRVVSEW